MISMSRSDATNIMTLRCPISEIKRLRYPLSPFSVQLGNMCRCVTSWNEDMEFDDVSESQCSVPMCVLGGGGGWVGGSLNIADRILSERYCNLERFQYINRVAYFIYTAASTRSMHYGKTLHSMSRLLSGICAACLEVSFSTHPQNVARKIYWWHRKSNDDKFWFPNFARDM